MTPHELQVWEARAGLISLNAAALQSSIWPSAARPVRTITRLSPAFCLTFAPGSVAVPLGDAVVPRVFRFSSTTV